MQEVQRLRLHPQVSAFVWKRKFFFSGLAYHQHVSVENGNRKRIFSKTLSRMNISENAFYTQMTWYHNQQMDEEKHCAHFPDSVTVGWCGKNTNGSFKDHKAILKDKAKRSIFATGHHLDFLRPPINIYHKLFNSLYLAILMYGSEVWSIYDNSDYNSWENDIIATSVC